MKLLSGPPIRLLRLLRANPGLPALLVSGIGFATGPAAAQRPLHGVVADQATMSLIDSARVTVVGTELEAVTGGDGTFSFEGVPLGSLAVRIEAPGYPVIVEQVEVVQDVVLYMQVMMPRADVILGELVTPPSA
ncbi:MAG: carboxypeptidase-like regulatory domain-containing protein [Gammaproteobacteria bacterium]|nr:carboxypeptidase-like regulatory domain-containing protein [Gammaproteobacteria bacterium]